MRVFLLLCLILFLPAFAFAVEAPVGQIPIRSNEVMRGHFEQQQQMKQFNNPLQSSGHFVLAPGYGLIWATEKPMATTTIITPNAMAQDMGGIAIKLPAKNLHHLYHMVAGALSGDWNELDKEYTMTRNGNAKRWQMLLIPRPNKKHSTSYTSITVSGGKFIENIAMMKADGNYDMLNFSDAALSQEPLSAYEVAIFNEAAH